MERILHKGEWFDAITPGSLYEHQFQAVVESNAGYLFPGYHLVPFTPVVESEDGSNRPDFSLVDRYYRSWWVVEVELSTHSLEGHVVPQVSTLLRGSYARDEAHVLAKNAPRLDKTKLGEMVRMSQPQVLVVADHSNEVWGRRIENLGARFMSVQMLRSDRDETLLRVAGVLDSSPEDELSMCRVFRPIPRFVQVQSPANLDLAVGQAVSIVYQGGQSQWTRVDTADHVLLHPERANPLSATAEYILVRATDGQLTFRRKD